jgi:serine/threonine protein kinase
VLLEKYANRPDVARRFIEEAQIGGQLQHPGVVPVYDIGRFGDRPFFTMKLVKGQTLAALWANAKVGPTRPGGPAARC